MKSDFKLYEQVVIFGGTFNGYKGFITRYNSINDTYEIMVDGISHYISDVPSRVIKYNRVSILSKLLDN